LFKIASDALKCGGVVMINYAASGGKLDKHFHPIGTVVDMLLDNGFEVSLLKSGGKMTTKDNNPQTAIKSYEILARKL
jgi:hypothetical protein